MRESKKVHLDERVVTNPTIMFTKLSTDFVDNSEWVANLCSFYYTTTQLITRGRGCATSD